MDIKLISPKLILYEKLINDNFVLENDPITIIIDLGIIEAKTILIEKLKGYNYEES